MHSIGAELSQKPRLVSIKIVRREEKQRKRKFFFANNQHILPSTCSIHTENGSQNLNEKKKLISCGIEGVDRDRRKSVSEAALLFVLLISRNQSFLDEVGFNLKFVYGFLCVYRGRGGKTMGKRGEGVKITEKMSSTS